MQNAGSWLQESRIAISETLVVFELATEKRLDSKYKFRFLFLPKNRFGGPGLVSLHPARNSVQIPGLISSVALESTPFVTKTLNL